MPYIPPEVVQEAKRMDLLTYLKNYEPYELVHFSGNTYTTRTHDSLKISNGKWMWWSRGIGGRSALDYLIKVKDYSFLEAVELLCRTGKYSTASFCIRAASSGKTSAVTKRKSVSHKCVQLSYRTGN